MDLESIHREFQNATSFDEKLNVCLAIRTVLVTTRAVIFDFDGPGFHVFKHHSAAEMAIRLREQFAALVSHWPMESRY
jgi:hypothetical protein